jgi:very-short-patch-repair endonuclease
MPLRKQSKPEKLVYAKHLRRHLTKAEKILWNYLRYNQLGFRFRRQEIILGWIVDFYCAQAKLVIEVDGPYHDSTVERDAYRTTVMEEHGILVFRVDNESVERKPEEVVSKIKEQATLRLLKLR